MEKFSPQRVEKEVISMRIVSDTLMDIDKKAAETGISRNEFINQCITFALANMENPTETTK
jgi:predicted DNA binding CopG/RHH family protein